MSFPIVEVENLSKSIFCNGRFISLLKEISFVVEFGDIFGIIGFSGAGKSTLLSCLASFTKISSGIVRIKDRVPSEHESNGVFIPPDRIGYVFQDFRLLFAKTILDNVAYPLIIQGWNKQKALREAERLIRIVGLDHKRYSYPSSLSGGEKQKIALARALANCPAVLLCDEVTSSLDTQSKEDIIRILSDMNRQFGITIIFVSHEMNAIKRLCNRIMVLDRGRKLEENFTEDLFLFPQSSVTKSLLGGSGFEAISHYGNFLNDKENTEILRLGFRRNNAFRPILGEVLRRTTVTINILAGDIDLLGCSSVGFLVVAITGKEVDRMEFKRCLASENVIICSSI